MERLKSIFSSKLCLRFWNRATAETRDELVDIELTNRDTARSELNIESYPRGYPQYSALISSSESFFIFRSFYRLRARVLLTKQDELHVLESRLDQVDRGEIAPFFLGTTRDDGNADRKALLAEISLKITEFGIFPDFSPPIPAYLSNNMWTDAFINQCRHMLTYCRANSRDVASLQNWLESTGCLVRHETSYLERENDLVSLATSDDVALKRLEDFIEDRLIQYYKGFRSTKAWPQRLGFDASTNPDIYLYTGSLIKSIAKGMMVLIMCFLLLTPVVICILVDRTATRISIIFMSTALFLGVLAWLTRSRMIELILAGATFATVLTVFVSNTTIQEVASLMDDVDEAIRIARHAVSATPSNDPSRAESLLDLASKLDDKYQKNNQRTSADLEEIIDLHRQAVEETPADHPDLGQRLQWLHHDIASKYTETGALADLEETIRIVERLVKVTAGKDQNDFDPESNWDFWLFQLKSYLWKRYNKTEELDHQREYIRTCETFVHGADLSESLWISEAQHLELYLTDVFGKTGDVSLLDEAISLAQTIVDKTATDDPDRAERLDCLGDRLAKRFVETRAMSDIEEAIKSSQQAVELTPKEHRDYPVRSTNFVLHMSSKYSITGKFAELEEIIRRMRDIVNVTPDDHWHQARGQHSLASQLLHMYGRTGILSDLHEAIQLAETAVAKVPSYLAQTRAYYLDTLGSLLKWEYITTGDPALLDRMINTTQQAVESTPVGHPERASFLRTLAEGFHEKYRITKATSDFESALTYNMSVIHQENAPVLTRILAGKEVLNLCAEAPDWERAFQVSNTVVDLISKLSLRSLGTMDRLNFAFKISRFACDAAASAFHAGKGPVAALKFLEQGRGLMIIPFYELWADISELEQKEPELADDFARLRNEVSLLVARDSPDSGSGSPSGGQASRRRYDVSQELERVVAAIQKKPGFERFLLPANEEEMRAAARHGPIIVINSSRHRCDAILIETNQIRSLTLPHFAYEDLGTYLFQGDVSSPKVLGWLWDVVAKPILEALGFARPPIDGESWPHVWWITTGHLSKFPVHAAGDYSEHRVPFQTVLDRVMSSYSSSVMAIIHGRQRRRRTVASPATAQALLVAMEQTSGCSKLDFATTEAAMLRGVFKSLNLDCVEPRRSRQDVLSTLSSCDVFHFCGHGHSDVNPSRSRLLLEDWQTNPLTVADLLEANLRDNPPFLAYLSACGTGRIEDEIFVDENIHLISACNLSGFRHVIGTMWEVDDSICVDMAKLTYEGMRDRGMTDLSVCRGLHNATRKLRSRWLDMLARNRGAIAAIEALTISNDGTVDDTGDVGLGDQNRMRKFEWIEEEEEDGDDEEKGKEERGSSGHWIPFIHFGV
ncbi:uncharacterized protein E0L32_006489 [Thyridium curvatum]|uniref:Uncharacterized protein n=1 Tax=Thyridium curvatum TaxID=1093900 RepID=A0A507AZJ1_9PEZI|nr:uncharacterized protein E0L32_006489 [Thyridium curvatum]TPX13063.1 hypothetical protein E0L32_006489 [Thyridium curvatum]